MEQMIGSIIITHKGEEGMIVDRLLSYCNSSNYTTYLVMKDDRTTFMIEPEDINIIKHLSGYIDISKYAEILKNSL